MDHAACHVIYCDKRADVERYFETSNFPDLSTKGDPTLQPPREVRDNISALLSTFNGVLVCKSGISCMARIRELEASAADTRPAMVFLEVAMDVEEGERCASHSHDGPSLFRTHHLEVANDPEDYYGLQLLNHIAAEISHGQLSRLVVPIAVINDPDTETGSRLLVPLGLPKPGTGPLQSHGQSDECKSDDRTSWRPIEPYRMLKCLETGAVDVLRSPLSKRRLEPVLVHAYKAHISAIKQKPAFLDLKRMRKKSWVGVDEEKPYAYLRESMVSTLMSSICKPESNLPHLETGPKLYAIEPSRENQIAQAIGTWAFPAHDLSDDELVHAAYLMLVHALSMPALEKWRIPTDDLKRFLMACRAAYNSFVLYHNFRHVVDVLQAVFYFLLQIGTLPAYRSHSSNDDGMEQARSPIAELLEPFDAFVLLVAAIGHDVGHPGVNNAFLVALKAPLAQLYNDKSVLEAFHCAAYSQLLRRYWKVVFEDIELRRLLINTILATDMGVHPEYMANMGNLQEKLHHNGGTDGWDGKATQSSKDLTLGLLIKCADISNVARPFKIAAKWATILQKEFARQGEMERDVGMGSVLFGGPPELGNVIKLANSQTGFMNFFAVPLFDGVADLMPGMKFAVDEIMKNKEVWEKKVQEEKHKEEMKIEVHRYQTEGWQSPRSASPNRTVFSTVSPEDSHPEGIPASGASPDGPIAPPTEHPADAPTGEALRPPRALGSNPQEESYGQRGSGRTSPGLRIIPTGGATEDMRIVSHRGAGVYPAARSAPSDRSLRPSKSSVLPSPVKSDENIAPSPEDASDTDALRYQRPQSSPSTATVPIFGGADSSQPSAERGAARDSTPPAVGNFSRPMSYRQHSLQAPRTRPSNDASRAKTITGGTLSALSLSDAKAVSVITEERDAEPETCGEADASRPVSGYSSAFAGNIPSRATSSGSGSIARPPATGGRATNGHGEGEKEVRRKTSRFRLDFWRKKKDSADAFDSS